MTEPVPAAELERAVAKVLEDRYSEWNFDRYDSIDFMVLARVALDAAAIAAVRAAVSREMDRTHEDLNDDELHGYLAALAWVTAQFDGEVSDGT